MALKGLHGRYYEGRIICAEYGPTGNWRELGCRQNDTYHCMRGRYCSFIHFKKVPQFARKYLNRMRKKYDLYT